MVMAISLLMKTAEECSITVIIKYNLTSSIGACRTKSLRPVNGAGIEGTPWCGFGSTGHRRKTPETAHRIYPPVKKINKILILGSHPRLQCAMVVVISHRTTDD